MRNLTKFNQWQNSFSVIEWFEELNNKQSLTFIQFDIVEFYPNITETLLKKALEYAKKNVNVTEDEIKIILETKKAILFSDGIPWTKKGNKKFDVTMGSWDGAEVADLVGLFLLSQLKDLHLNIGLYRDDGLAVCNLSERQAELTKKKLCRIFKENGLNITAEANKKNVNFLDVNLDLNTGLYRPYMKPNDVPTYVHKDSNHPKAILENIPHSVNRRLSAISSNSDVFKSAIPPYQEALNRSGYNYTLHFDPPAPTGGTKNRSRNITYFNPPFSRNVETNIGKQFLRLKQKISNHNFQVKKAEEETQLNHGCNCTQVIGTCPLGGNCLVNSVVYGAEVTDSQSKTETYTGLTSNTFKTRF